ncbi:MAG: hypothetical protein IJ449_00015 [Clostridia bacterium]|nr:hypothetical protein [Clostridia bacterium]
MPAQTNNHCAPASAGAFLFALPDAHPPHPRPSCALYAGGWRYLEGERNVTMPFSGVYSPVTAFSFFCE